MDPWRAYLKDVLVSTRQTGSEVRRSVTSVRVCSIVTSDNLTMKGPQVIWTPPFTC